MPGSTLNVLPSLSQSSELGAVSPLTMDGETEAQRGGHSAREGEGRDLNWGPSVFIITRLGPEGEGWEGLAAPSASTPHFLQQSLTVLDQLRPPNSPTPKC